ncbi:hypothetical protein LZC95_30900 [Pendulispora brunnea]|uniref:Uncharacterized protein n=1 Tax=Pendulispora brunnea TaxID=2905690 RepID=A0ABZ2JZX9_9BACT
MRSWPFVLCFAMAGCAGNEKPVDQPQTFNGQEGYPPQQEPLPAQSLPRAQPLAPTANPPPAPAPSASASSAAGAPASPLPGIPVDPALLGQMGAGTMAILTPGGVANDPIEAGIKASAARSAPNMQPEGQMAKDTLQENGHKAMVVTLTGGKCYAIVGFSPSGQIRNLDLHLLAPPFYNVQVGKDDTADGTPVIGKGTNPTCPITPFPLQYKLDIHAQKGSGPFGVQVFSRPK